MRSNRISRKISKQNKFIYQKVIVYEFILKNVKNGLALMDGKFFSYLPKGQSNKHILYHVKHSVLKQKVSSEFPISWNKKNKINEINNSKKNFEPY